MTRDIDQRGVAGVGSGGGVRPGSVVKGTCDGVDGADGCGVTGAGLGASVTAGEGAGAGVTASVGAAVSVELAVGIGDGVGVRATNADGSKTAGVTRGVAFGARFVPG